MNQRSSNAEHAAHRLRLGSFTLDLLQGELRSADGELAPLRRQALELLCVLGRQANRVVGKDQLMSEVWPGVVVGDGSLTQAIAEIRRLLGDDDHKLVRTVARRGYMLVPEAPAAQGAEGAAPGAALLEAPRRRRWWLAAVAGGAVLAGGWALRRYATPPAPTPLTGLPALSLVVLPLHLEDGAGVDDWLASALHADLTTEVGRIQGAFVIARDTAVTYRGKPDIDPRQVARELGVRYVVRGRLRREEERLRLNLALIDGESGAQRWADQLTTERARLPAALGEFAIALARVLQAPLYDAAARRSATLSAAEQTADDLAMQAMAQWFRGYGRDNVLAGIELAERAVAIDPNCLRGWAALSFMSNNAAINGWAADRDAAFRRVADAAAALERIDPDDFFAYQARSIALFRRRDFAGLVQQNQAWAERHRHPIAYAGWGMALVLVGREEEGIPILEKAIRLSPRDPFRAEVEYRLAMAHFIAGRDEQARDYGRAAEARNPMLPWPPVHAAALLNLGERAAAQETFAAFKSRHPNYVAAQVAGRLPSDVPRFAAGRERLIAGLRELGLR